MPQLIPDFFVNQVTFVFILMIVTLYILSKYILPNFVALFMARISVLLLIKSQQQ